MKPNLKWHDKNGRMTPLYRKWVSARSRCYNPNNLRYPLYGGRGVRMCDEWLMSYESFARWAYANGYETGLSLDRIDNDKGYSPDNCRFVTLDEQKRNRRFCHRVVVDGVEYRTLQDLADKVGVSQNTLTRRLKRGWPVEVAAKLPVFSGRAPKEYDEMIRKAKNHVYNNALP